MAVTLTVGVVVSGRTYRLGSLPAVPSPLVTVLPL